MKDINKRKRKILSVRLTDNELEAMNELMAANQLNVSELLREALVAFLSHQPQQGYDKSSLIARAA